MKIPALKCLSCFHYLHKKHAALISQGEYVLSEMEKEGTTLAIRNNILKYLMDEKFWMRLRDKVADNYPMVDNAEGLKV